MSSEFRIKEIRQYVLGYSGIDYITMPRGAKILHVESIAAKVHMWAMVDPDAIDVVRTFQVVMGTYVPANGTYLATTVSGEHMIWHVFELDAADPAAGEKIDEYSHITIAKDTLAALNAKFDDAISDDMCTFNEDNTVNIIVPVELIDSLEKLAGALNTTPEGFLRQALGMKAN